ncbi:hypothetical protein P3T25_009664 [Paraburkholderia sp. GAS32]
MVSDRMWARRRHVIVPALTVIGINMLEYQDKVVQDVAAWLPTLP